MNKFTIQQLQQMRESEDRVEFKAGEVGNVSYDGRGKTNPKDRRRCILGYIIALCNEGGGRLVIGMHDNYPHRVIGTRQAQDAIGQLESDIYRDTLKKLLSQELLIETSDGIKLTPLYDEMKQRAGVTDRTEGTGVPKNDTVNVPVNDTVNLTQLTERQRKIYEAIKNIPVNVPVNVPNLASMLGVSEKTIKRDIAAMHSAGLIKRVGSDKTGHWEVVE